MTIRFNKYHGTGNDFIIIDRDEFSVFPEQELISLLCHRRFGIGADGLILFLPHEQYDFRMIYFNADGREGSMCGNGGRCMTAHAAAETGRDSFSFLAADGVHHATVNKVAGQTSEVSLGLNDVTELHKMGEMVYLNTGSPHLVCFVDDPEQEDVLGRGRELRYDGRFKDGTNVNFVSCDGNKLYVRTYERGVEDETLSCGTGVTASAIAASWLYGGNTFDVRTRGGELQVAFEKNGNAFTSLRLTGPAVFVFSGEINI